MCKINFKWLFMLRCIIELLPDNSFLKKCYTKIRRAKNISRRAKRIPEYLKDNNFEVELNYKLWITKGTRFKASERCEELDARYSELVSAAKQNYNHMLTALRDIDITKILTLGDYKFKQLKEYFNSAKNNIVNLVASKDRIKSGSIRARRDFMRYSESDIRKYVENEYFYTKWIMDEIVSTLK